jgi:hypothetical protein
MERNLMVEVYLSFIQRLEKNSIDYMVVGSIASSVYGDPRLTHDLDIVVKLELEDAGIFERIFPENEYYCPPTDVIAQEIKKSGQFNLIHHESGYKMDVILVRKVLHDTEEFKRRQKVPFWKGQSVFMATPEDIIIKKLEFYRKGGSEKHLRDIASILRHTEVDNPYLDKWIATLALQNEWKKATHVQL